MAVGLLIQELEKVLREHTRYIPADADIDPDVSLAALGIDSLDLIELIIQIEDEFDLEIPPENVNPETFATPASIWRMLCQIDPKLAESEANHL